MASGPLAYESGPKKFPPFLDHIEECRPGRYKEQRPEEAARRRFNWSFYAITPGWSAIGYWEGRRFPHFAIRCNSE